MFNLYKINQNRLNFLPSIFSLSVLCLFLGAVFWYFTPLKDSEVKVIALKEIVKTEQISGKFFGYLDYFEEPKSQISSSISDPNPEITVKSFDSRLINEQTFYLSKDCQNMFQKNCQIWTLDRTATLPKELVPDISQIKSLQNNTQFESFQKVENFAKFAEKQDKNQLNIIIKSENNKKENVKKVLGKNEKLEESSENEIQINSIGLLQIDKNNPQNSLFEILTLDNPKYLLYFR